MANQDFRKMTQGVAQDALEKRIYTLEHGGAGTPSIFRKPITFAPEPEAGPGVSIRSVTDPGIEAHNTFVIYAADGETILLRIDNSGSIETTGRVNADTPRFFVRSSTAQVFSGNDFARVQFNNIVYDTHAVFTPWTAGPPVSGGWFTVPTDWPGVWAFSAAVLCSTNMFGLIRAMIGTDPTGGTSFSTRSEGTSYKSDRGVTILNWGVAVPYKEIELVAGERGVVEMGVVLNATPGPGPPDPQSTIVVSTNEHTFFWGKWVHD